MLRILKRHPILALISAILAFAMWKADQTAKQRLVESTPAQNPPLTARYLPEFEALKRDMTRPRVHAMVGYPDRNIGSHINIDLYELADGSSMRLSYNPHLVSVSHSPLQGQPRELLSE